MPLDFSQCHASFDIKPVWESSRSDKPFPIQPVPPQAPRRSSQPPQPCKNFWETGVKKPSVSKRLEESLEISTGQIGTSKSTLGSKLVGKTRKSRQTAKKAPESDDEYDPLAGFAFLTADEVLQGNERQHWQAAMDKEIKTLEEFGTWKLVDLPPGRKTIGCKWHLTRKVNADGSLGEYKARLVAKGYSQIEGVDYFETFAPVARIQSIRIILALANDLDLEVDQIDIKAAYLNGWMDEEIYMVQPLGYVNRRARRKACLLIRGLYGTKQAGNIWNKSLNGTMVKNLSLIHI